MHQANGCSCDDCDRPLAERLIARSLRDDRVVVVPYDAELDRDLWAAGELDESTSEGRVRYVGSDWAVELVQ
jgi:hypothetical protein